MLCYRSLSANSSHQSANFPPPVPYTSQLLHIWCPASRRLLDHPSPLSEKAHGDLSYSFDHPARRSSSPLGQLSRFLADTCHPLFTLYIVRRIQSRICSR
ncbi:hypothetical protein PoB_001667700 [Plakobranchus ocellatus]|uniref:Uncharacterized protein n=1 Tax=Plakobranchus ocellatus TaxID=259542 RepID=A0AAV3Z6I7_9GAST|nr:hypothetical protein PoB_001667700 [Plakobranchus ocellatus]